MLSSMSKDVNGEGCRQSFTKARGLEKFKGKGLFKVNRGDRVDKFRYVFRDEN